MSKDNSAFPVMHCIDGNWIKNPKSEYMGLTKREYFAAMAMQGILASPRGASPEHISTYALACAEALINALNAEK